MTYADKRGEQIVDVKTIKSEEDYDAALVEIERLFASKPGSDDFDRLEVLAVLVQDYERMHHPVGPPDLDSMIDYKLEKRGFPGKEMMNSNNGAHFSDANGLNGGEPNAAEVSEVTF